MCSECGRPHSESNYVATDADGVTCCGDCCDAALGATIIVQCAFAPGNHLCACGNDLRLERWFAVESTPTAAAHCQACCLSFWGLTSADMIVSAFTDSRMAHRDQEGGAHLPSSTLTPYDDASRPAGLSDRGFSTGLAPKLLDGCMNLSSRPGEQMLSRMRARRGRRTHAHPRAFAVRVRAQAARPWRQRRHRATAGRTRRQRRQRRDMLGAVSTRHTTCSCGSITTTRSCGGATLSRRAIGQRGRCGHAATGAALGI